MGGKTTFWLGGDCGWGGIGVQRVQVWALAVVSFPFDSPALLAVCFCIMSIACGIGGMAGARRRSLSRTLLEISFQAWARLVRWSPSDLLS